jgi:hypothetical protein
MIRGGKALILLALGGMAHGMAFWVKFAHVKAR